MFRTSLVAILLVTAVTFVAACGPAAETYDLVISGGRVIDPETGLDAIRNVGIRAGRIEAVSENELEGDRVIDATGLVVTPGFIDLHEHGQDTEAYGLMVRDGVTTALELEVGAGDVAAWYAEREGGQMVNYGVSAGHIPARMTVMGDEGTFLPRGPGGHQVATDAQVAEMAALLEKGLAEGAVAAGFGTAYTPAATMEEIETLFRVAAQHGATVHIHMKGELDGLAETMDVAASAGVGLHIVHVNSSGGPLTAEFIEAIEERQALGQDVTTEAYPYGAGMTALESALFDDWREWDEEEYAKFQWVETGERLNRESFETYRAQGGTIIWHSRTEEMTLAAMVSPTPMIASDGFIANGRGHPRTSGTYAKVLGQYVRDLGVIQLPDAIRRMTLEPARRLEDRVPSMAQKGRIQVGMDADVTVFNPETVIDRATYLDATIPSEGIEFVLVNGTPVVDGGELVTGTRSGHAIRAPLN